MSTIITDSRETTDPAKLHVEAEAKEAKLQRKMAARQARQEGRHEKRQAKSEAKQAQKANAKEAAKCTSERKGEQKIKVKLNQPHKTEKRRTRMLSRAEKLEVKAVKMMSEAKKLRATYELLTKEKDNKDDTENVKEDQDVKNHGFSSLDGIDAPLPTRRVPKDEIALKEEAEAVAMDNDGTSNTSSASDSEGGADISFTSAPVKEEPEKVKGLKKNKERKKKQPKSNFADEEINATKLARKERKAEKKRKREGEVEDEEESMPKEKSKGKKKSKSNQPEEPRHARNNAEESWNVGELKGDDARKQKFLRLLGAKKGDVADQISKADSYEGGEKDKLDMSRVQYELQHQFEMGTRMKFEQAGQRRGLGA